MGRRMATKILIVDDRPETLSDLVEQLKVHDYEVLFAADGVEALQKARQDKPAVIILDVMMPRLDGFQTARMIKFDKQLKHTPVLILTVRTRPADRDAGLKMGADEYITKPFETGQLVERIRYWATKTAEPSPKSEPSS